MFALKNINICKDKLNIIYYINYFFFLKIVNTKKKLKIVVRLYNTYLNKYLKCRVIKLLYIIWNQFCKINFTLNLNKFQLTNGKGINVNKLK